jgi:hypothetical protein
MQSDVPLNVKKPSISDRDHLLEIDAPTQFVADTVAGPLIGTTAATMRRWRYEGRGPRYTKVGSSVRYRIADLESFVSQRTVETRDSARPEEAGGGDTHTGKGAHG